MAEGQRLKAMTFTETVPTTYRRTAGDRIRITVLIHTYKHVSAYHLDRKAHDIHTELEIERKTSIFTQQFKPSDLRMQDRHYGTLYTRIHMHDKYMTLTCLFA